MLRLNALDAAAEPRFVAARLQLLQNAGHVSSMRFLKINSLENIRLEALIVRVCVA
jgi:hypothetical protein